MSARADKFFASITPDILGPAEYVDWAKVDKFVLDYRREIALLQSLNKKNPVGDLADLLGKYPRILVILQHLVAHTPEKLYFTPELKIDFKNDQEAVEKSVKRATEIANMFLTMGLFEFLEKVTSVQDVLKGVLIGLEPNSRKSRRGEIFADQVRALLDSVLVKINRERNQKLTFVREVYISFKDERKKVDFVVCSVGKEILAIEVNFYSTSGSKPSEIIGRAYPDVQESLRHRNIDFVVITDGAGWNSMHPVIETGLQRLNNLMNLSQARDGLLEAAVIASIEKH